MCCCCRLLELELVLASLYAFHHPAAGRIRFPVRSLFCSSPVTSLHSVRVRCTSHKSSNAAVAIVIVVDFQRKAVVSASVQYKSAFEVQERQEAFTARNTHNVVVPSPFQHACLQSRCDGPREGQNDSYQTIELCRYRVFLYHQEKCF